MTYKQNIKKKILGKKKEIMPLNELEERVVKVARIDQVYCNTSHQKSDATINDSLKTLEENNHQELSDGSSDTKKSKKK